MESVGVRDLKNRLSYYLSTVQQGSSLVVTLRGTPVARLTPICSPAKGTLPPELEERMWRLVAKGLLAWNGGSVRIPEPAGVNRGPRLLSNLVVEDRE